MTRPDAWRSDRFRLLLTGVVFLGVFLVTAATIPHYGLSWDEPPSFIAIARQMDWLAAAWQRRSDPQLQEHFRDEVIVRAWNRDPYQVPHPPFPRILSGLSRALFSPPLHPFDAYRLPAALFFALLVTCMFRWMTRLYGLKTGLFTAACLVVFPNLFGYAHLAVTDMPLASLWLATVYAFTRGLTSWRWSLVLGIVWGLAVSTKFPALLIPIPLVLWAHLFHRTAYSGNLVSMLCLSPAVVVCSQPYLWHQPFVRLVQFLHEGVSRGYRPETQFPVFYAHALHASADLPWYYAGLMTAVTIPETLLLLIGVGLWALTRRSAHRDILLLFLANALFILGLGLVPGAVLHDVTRLTLPALPFLAGVAGYGFFALCSWWEEIERRQLPSSRLRNLRRTAVVLTAAICLISSAADLWRYHPFELSYFNRLVGGVRGAFGRGFEVTYFMEAMTPDFLALLNERLPPHATVNASFSNFMLEYYQRYSLFRRDVRVVDTLPADYYILLNRKSFFSRGDWAIWRGPWPRLATLELHGVPLIVVFQAKGMELPSFSGAPGIPSVGPPPLPASP